LQNRIGLIRTTIFSIPGAKQIISVIYDSRGCFDAGGPYTEDQDCEKLTGIFIWLAII
jgi:hypothetical protein